MTTRCLTIDVEMRESFGHVHLALYPRGEHGSVTISCAAEKAGDTLLEWLTRLIDAFGTPVDDEETR